MSLVCYVTPFLGGEIKRGAKWSERVFLKNPLVLGLIVFSLCAQAEEYSEYNMRPEPFRRSIQLGLNYHHFNYQEEWTLPAKSIDRGNLPTLELEYKSLFSQAAGYSLAKLSYSFGSVIYDGALQDSSGKYAGDLTKEQNGNSFLEIETQFGVRLKTFSSRSHLLGYLGLGYHRWHRGDGQGGKGDYREIYSWNYIPVGVRFENEVNSKFSWNLDLSIRPTFLGNIYVYNSDIHPNEMDAEMSLGSKLGFKAQLPLVFSLSPKTELSLTPEFEYSAIGQSNWAPLYLIDGSSVTNKNGDPMGIREPSSRTYKYGATLAFRVGF